MNKLVQWLTINGYTLEVKKCVGGSDCVFIKLLGMDRFTEKKLMQHLKRSHHQYQYAGYYEWVRVDF